MNFKTKSALVLAGLALLPSCTFNIVGNESHDKSHKIVAKSCSYAPLWLAPMNSKYLNLEDIKSKNNIKEVTGLKHVVYPFVLYTKSCLIVEGK